MTLSIEGEIVTPDTQLTNTTYDELEVGMSASLVKRLTMQDIQLFAVMSGDYNPAHLDGDYAKSSRFHEIIAHGMWGGALISTVLGTVLPGIGTIYVSQTLEFCRPVHLGDTLTVTVTVLEKLPKSRKVLANAWTTNHSHEFRDSRSKTRI
ncbi:MAG: MaoC/PaaZ C-terminal domain-containing protein, partial [Litorivicinaceae bacterium]